MKKIVVVRGGQEKPLVKDKDIFDSIIHLYMDSDLVNYHTIQNVNTDYFLGYEGGILAEGKYGGIVFTRDNGKKAVKLFQINYINTVKKESDITEAMRVFPSLIRNKNHGWKNIITQVLIHSDGKLGGYSQGCITVYPDQWSEFIDKFELGEIVEIELIRNPAWIAPAHYLGN